MSAFYTFLSSLINCLLKFISLMILLGEVRKFLEEAHLAPPLQNPALDGNELAAICSQQLVLVLLEQLVASLLPSSTL